MTTDDLDALERLAREATPGRWEAEGRTIHLGVTQWPMEDPDGTFLQGFESAGIIYDEGGHREADAAYIAALSPDVVLRLIAAARREPEPGAARFDAAVQRAFADVDGVEVRTSFTASDPEPGVLAEAAEALLREADRWFAGGQYSYADRGRFDESREAVRAALREGGRS